MGLIYNNNVEETEIYHAYRLTVYGKINRYVSSIFGYREEDVLTTVRITDAENNDIVSVCVGNNCISQSRIDDTLDNFLWWIAEDKPDSYTIEKQVYKSLCASDCLFNHQIQQRKFKQRREEENMKRRAELEKKKLAAVDSIKAYCSSKGLIPCFTYDNVYIIKVCNENVLGMFQTAKEKTMENFIDFMEKYPDNKDAYIVKSGTIEDILTFMV